MAAEDTIKLPVEVDQQGRTIHFTTNAESEVAAEAARFCAAHLRAMPSGECVAKLVEQVKAVREARTQAALSLPGLTFTVQNAQGETLRFVHEELADPAEESREFCRQHFSDADEREHSNAWTFKLKRIQR